LDKKGCQLWPREKRKGMGNKAGRFADVKQGHSNASASRRPFSPSLPHSFVTPPQRHNQAFICLVAKEERDEQGRQSEERGRERAITLVFARLVPSARSLSLPSSLSAPSAPSASPSRTKKNWDLPEPARARETARKMGANLMLKRVGEGERAKKGLDEASKAKRK